MPAVDTINVIKEQLAKKDVHCAVYSGSFTDVENSNNFSSWRDGNVAVMVATSAFGVGIDYPSVRTVFLYGLPYTVANNVDVLDVTVSHHLPLSLWTSHVKRQS